MSHFSIIIAYCIIFITFASFSILRIRLTDGQTHRLNLDEKDDNIETIKQCHARLVSLNKISSSSKLVIRGSEYDSSSTNTLKSLNLENGELINIIDTTTFVEETPIKSIKATKIKVKKALNSVAALDAKRRGMEKIIPQKANTRHSVYFANSIERMLTRMISHGGFSLLLGKVESSDTSKGSKYKKKITTTSGDNYDLLRNVTVIHATAEVFVCPEGSTVLSFLDQVRDNESEMIRVKRLADSLGLDIVGCAVSLPTTSSSSLPPTAVTSKEGHNSDLKVDTKAAETWSSAHIYATVRARELLSPQNSDLFVTLE